MIIEKANVSDTKEINGLLDKIQKFIDVGVHAKLVRRNIIGSDTRLFADFIIYKDIVVISTIGYKGLLNRVRITGQKHEVQDYIHNFEELMKIGEDINK